MLLVLKRTLSMRRFFLAPKTYVKINDKKIQPYLQFHIKKLFFPHFSDSPSGTAEIVCRKQLTSSGYSDDTFSGQLLSPSQISCNPLLSPTSYHKVNFSLRLGEINSSGYSNGTFSGQHLSPSQISCKPSSPTSYHKVNFSLRFG